MSRPGPSPLREWSAAVALAAATAGILAWLLGRNWPHVGFDFSYFLPRLLDVRLHQMAESWWSVQWWTPSFGAGLPAFPNPQHTQFMPAQGLVPLFGPWGAAVWQACLCLVAGMLLVFHACRRLGCSAEGSLVATAAWGTAGFFWEHALTGHMGFNSFPLVAMLPLALQRSLNLARGAALLGLTGAFFAFTGGYTIVLAFALSALLLAWTLPLWRPEEFRVSDCLRRLALGGALAAVVGAAKLVAGNRFLAVFPRLADGAYEGAWWTAPGVLLAQLFAHNPLALASRWLPFSRESIRETLGGAEHVGFGPVVAFILATGLILTLRARREGVWAHRGTWLGLLVAVWIVAEFALGRGLLWSGLKPLPFLRSLHENHRLTAAFLLPLTLLIAPAWDRLLAWRPRRIKLAATTIAVLACLLSLEPYARSRADLWFEGYDASHLARTWHELRHADAARVAIDRVADLRDDEGFLARASSWKPYEPIFGYGYGGTAFRPQAVPGPIAPSDPGVAFNVTDVRTLMHGGGSNADPFALLPASEAAALARLLHRQQPDWPQPLAQRVANWISVAGFGVTLALAAWPRSPTPCSG